MASPAERRRRRQVKQDLAGDETLLLHQDVLYRCGPVWVDAWAVLQAEDVTFAEFAAPDWTCAGCPNLLACSLDNNLAA